MPKQNKTGLSMSVSSTYKDDRGQIREATDKMQALAQGLVFHGLSPAAAGKAAGYSGHSYCTTLRSAGFTAYLRQERERAFGADLAPRAIQTLREVMADAGAPAAARVTAARTALEVAGDLRRAADDPASSKRLSELSADQLASMLDTMKAERDRIALAVARDREAIDVQGEPVTDQ